MKRLAVFLLMITCLLGLFSCGESEYDYYEIEIEIENYGVITAVLETKYAPKTVKNFVELVESDFYTGLEFHRIINGFMMQGGAPKNDGSGEKPKTIKGEFKENGFENNMSHLRGTLSMARADDMDSASTQFFIMHQDGTYLDGKYAAFGRVTKGIEIVDTICTTTPVIDSNGSVPQGYRPIIKEIRITNKYNEEK